MSKGIEMTIFPKYKKVGGVESLKAKVTPRMTEDQTRRDDELILTAAFTRSEKTGFHVISLSSGKRFIHVLEKPTVREMDSVNRLRFVEIEKQLWKVQIKTDRATEGGVATYLAFTPEVDDHLEWTNPTTFGGSKIHPPKNST